MVSRPHLARLLLGRATMLVENFLGLFYICYPCFAGAVMAALTEKVPREKPAARVQSVVCFCWIKMEISYTKITKMVHYLVIPHFTSWCFTLNKPHSFMILFERFASYSPNCFVHMVHVGFPQC